MYDYQKSQPHLFPSEETQADMYDATVDISRLAGYKQYEVSSFSVSPAARSRHNLGYWTGRNFVGLGPGAHGRISVTDEHARYQTMCIRSPKQWVDQSLSDEFGHGQVFSFNSMGA